MQNEQNAKKAFAINKMEINQNFMHILHWKRFITVNRCHWICQRFSIIIFFVHSHILLKSNTHFKRIYLISIFLHFDGSAHGQHFDMYTTFVIMYHLLLLLQRFLLKLRHTCIEESSFNVSKLANDKYIAKHTPNCIKHMKKRRKMNKKNCANVKPLENPSRWKRQTVEWATHTQKY